MTPKNDMAYDLEFENQIKDFSPESQFLARQIYDICQREELKSKRIDVLEKDSRIALGTTGGLGVLIGGVINGLITYFKPG